ncbi:hypothetical protein KEJ21_06900 [Candidatus Bathyarchaeota archaeon]|nr:hypothetical protein [Candidatus Bathyarchaeota archaeon]MBS7631559.1 hypothetical protein [Candidatus Bathyarchaeota archaeon]
MNLKRHRLLILGASILGIVVLVEVFFYLAYPEVRYSPKTLPRLTPEEYHYTLLKDNATVGEYTFRVYESGMFKGVKAYFSDSSTHIVYKNKTIEIESYYIFDERLKPLEYKLNITVEGVLYTLLCNFSESSVNALYKTHNESGIREVNLPENTILLDINMVGQWYLFFKSFDMVPNTRYSFTAFIPQYLDKMSMGIFVAAETETIEIGGVKYECKVVKGTEQNFVYFIYGDQVLSFEDHDQNVVMYLLK